MRLPRPSRCLATTGPLPWLLLLALALGACGERATLPAADAAVDTDPADAASSDTPAPDGSDATADVGAWQPPPLAPPDEGTAVTVGSWAVAVVSPNTDAVGPALDAGTFTPPTAGTKGYGVTWLARKPDANGTFAPGGNGGSYVYAATRIAFAQAAGLVVRADRAFDVWVDGRRQPGDVYGSGQLRVPFRVEAGERTVVLRGRGGMQVTFSAATSSHEAAFNPHDRTWPHLRVGDGGERWLGVPVLVFGPQAALGVTARVVANDHFAATTEPYPALAGGAVTQIGFRLQPKQAPTAAGQKWPVELRIDSPGWSHSYAHTLELEVVAADATFRQTFRSPDDGSVQYYGVRPPEDFDPAKSYAMVLSLHGASVEAIDQANAYSSRDWTWLVAATNRRRFGFDWEEWGRINAIASLDDAMARFAADPTRVHLVGHSMGGHGTWHVGVHHAGRFAHVGPSAGWNSFYTYGGSPLPGGPFARARAHSKTTDFIGNLAGKGVYVIHGTADDNVPWSEGKSMLQAASAVTADIDHHWQEGAGHWWDGDAAPGADCVDWPELFERMAARTLDPTELDFQFTSAGPWYGASRSYATIASAQTPDGHCVLTSKLDAGQLTLATQNVRSLLLDGKALRAKGIEAITVDGAAHAVPDGPLAIGPTDGKRPLVTGPYNQVFQRPFLFVYPDGSQAYADYAAYLVSHWALIGNGRAGALALSQLTGDVATSHHLVYLGVARTDLAPASELPFTWDDEGADVKGQPLPGAALLSVFDDGSKLGAVLRAPAGKEYLLYRVVPFSSRSGMPDYLVWDDQGLVATGFYDADWLFDPALGAGW